MDSLVGVHLAHLQSGVAMGLLSKQQVDIFLARAEGASYATIRHRYKLCNDEAVARSLVRSALGFYWIRFCTGGRLSYLSELDALEFQAIVSERSAQINCTTKSEALTILFDLRVRRLRSAIELLRVLNLQRLSDRLVELYPEIEPDESELRTLCDKLKIKVCRPQMLELARRHFCDRDRVANFLIKFEPLFARDKRLIWNADETQLNSMKRFRVLCKRGILPLVAAMEAVPHLTGIVSISGGGQIVQPVIILKNFQNIGELADLQEHCFFATSSTGWITTNLWVYFALVFSAQMSAYRLTLPEAIRDNEILLVIDGHKSRLSFLAAMIFFLNSIDVLVLPAHSSHLLQMFDVAVASPLKTAFKQELDKRVSRIAHADPEQREKAGIIRRVLVESFINAVRRGGTPGNIGAGFRATGIVPFNPQVPLDSAYAVDHDDSMIFHAHRTGTEVNEMLLTSPEGLSFLCQHQNRREIVDDDYRIEWARLWQHLKGLPLLMGRALSEPPPLFVRGDDHLIRQIDLSRLPL